MAQHISEDTQNLLVVHVLLARLGEVAVGPDGDRHGGVGGLDLPALPPGGTPELAQEVL